MRKQFAKTMLELGGDERLVVMLGDLSHFLLRDFEAKYPDRFFNMGIAEQGMVGMAAGAAMNGFFPVVHSIAPFITERCLEQIKDDLCYQKLGANLVSIGAAFDYAALGCTHHCYDDMAILRAQPNMQVIIPGSSQEFDALFKETWANGSPTYFRLSENEHGIATSVKFGEIEKLSDGAHATVAVVGPQLKNAMAAVEAAAANGVACDLLYFSTIKPLSERAQAMIKESVQKTGRLIAVEEHSVVGGLGDVVGLVAKNIPHTQERIGVQDKFLTNYGKYEDHCVANGLTAVNIAEKIGTVVG
jgi:transketolase